MGILLGRETFEEEIARILEDMGPTVALGRKDELLSTLGFAKEYARDDNWKEILATYLRRAGWLVFVLYKVTPNLTYEINEALSQKYSARIIFIPPPFKHRTKVWYGAYFRLRSLNPTLPMIYEETAAVIFDKDEGQITINMQGLRTSSAQITAIHATLIERYLHR